MLSQTNLMKRVDLFIAPFIEYILQSFSGYCVSTSLLLSEPKAPCQDRKHYDFDTAVIGTECFSVVVPLNLSATLEIEVEEAKKDCAEWWMPVTVCPHQFFKFDGTVAHMGGKHEGAKRQYRIHLLFSKTDPKDVNSVCDIV